MEENKYFEEYESELTNLSIRWKRGKITKFVGRKQDFFPEVCLWKAPFAFLSLWYYFEKNSKLAFKAQYLNNGLCCFK